MAAGGSGGGPGSGGVIGFDRKLLGLITELADEGMLWPLTMALDTWGRKRAARVIADGFAVLRNRRNADADGGLGDANFVPIEDAPVIIHHLRKTAWDAPEAFVIVAGPWGAIGPEEEPNLIFRYVADDPGAVAEVRRRHAERLERWEIWRRSDVGR